MSVAAIAPPQAPPVSGAPCASSIQCESGRTAGLFGRAGALRGLLFCGRSSAIACASTVRRPWRLLAALLARPFAIIGARCAPRIALAPLCLAWILSGSLLRGNPSLARPADRLALLCIGRSLTLQGEVVRAGPVRIVESTAPFAQHGVDEKSQLLDLRVRAIADARGVSVPVSGGLRLSIYAPIDGPFRISLRRPTKSNRANSHARTIQRSRCLGFHRIPSWPGDRRVGEREGCRSHGGS